MSRSRKSTVLHPVVLVVGVSLAFVVSAAAAQTFTDLYSFCPEAGCADGDYPTAPLVADSSGDLFGTTALGSASGWGTIFELVKKKRGYSYKALHSFCTEANCTDGSDPQSGLIIDTAGNLYGTTKFGGAQNGGTAFELQQGLKAKFKVLHSFCAEGAACADGSEPMYDGLTYQGAENGTPYDGKSPLYGTTIYGSENDGGYAGSVYRLAPAKGGRKWKEKLIWQFCSQSNCADGSQPHNGLVMDSSGNLYGVTFAGGNGNNDGVAFELSPDNRAWSETVLHDFCSATGCADGSNPESALVPAATGFAGSASSGGARGDGALFSLVPDGTNSQFTVLYSFCSQSGCSDGSGPMGHMALNSSGDIFGTTVDGGDPDSSRGVVYELTAADSLNVLHTFCPGGNCSDGAWPVGGVTLDGSGDVFGTTSEGGANNEGAVFELVP
jgi:uncharacterized repeat protein (TIGR03803 family)